MKDVIGARVVGDNIKERSNKDPIMAIYIKKQRYSDNKIVNHV